MQPEAIIRLQDVLEACDTIRLYIDGRSLEDYLSDKMLRQAVERNFEIIGEAINPSAIGEITAATEIIHFRNLLIHGYAMVKDEVVWRTAQEDLTTLRLETQRLLRAAEQTESDQ